MILAAVFGFSAWVVRGNGRKWSTGALFLAVALPTLFVVYIGLGRLGI
jgi:hypothetical protein